MAEAKIIENGTTASVVRKSIENRAQLKNKGDIYIGTGNEIEKDIPDTKGQNIIDAINDNSANKDIRAGSFTAASFKGNADSATNATYATNADNATNARNADNATNATNATYAQYASEDTSKGTIEQRLTNLGFKQLLQDSNGSLSLSVAGAILDASISLLQSGTTREGNRTQASIQLNFHTTSSNASGPLLSFFSGTVAISNVFIPAEYQPAKTVYGFFGVRVSYLYQDTMSLDVYTAVYCEVYGANTNKAGKVLLQVIPPIRSGVSSRLIAVALDPETNPAKLELGYSSKPL